MFLLDYKLNNIFSSFGIIVKENNVYYSLYVILNGKTWKTLLSAVVSSSLYEMELPFPFSISVCNVSFGRSSFR